MLLTSKIVLWLHYRITVPYQICISTLYLWSSKGAIPIDQENIKAKLLFQEIQWITLRCMEFANNYANTRNSPRIASTLHNSTIPKICEHMKILHADKREKPMDMNLKMHMHSIWYHF